MILFLCFKFGSIFSSRERKTVRGLFCLSLNTIGSIGQMTLQHTKRQRVMVYSRGDEPICYRRPPCQLPLIKRAAQHLVIPVQDCGSRLNAGVA